jgi:hypothetical protein
MNYIVCYAVYRTVDHKAQLPIYTLYQDAEVNGMAAASHIISKDNVVGRVPLATILIVL